MMLMLCALMLSNYATKAEVTVQEWQDNYKGYSIKPINNGTEFIAAGTYYGDDNGTMFVGYHVLRLDSKGDVLASVTHYPTINSNNQYDQEFRVVDIAVEDQKFCWVVLQVRDFDYVNSTNQHTLLDYIYAERIDMNTGQLDVSSGSNNKLSVIQGLFGLYATSAIIMNGNMFISGYEAKISEVNNINIPTLPTNNSLYKRGCLFKVDMTGTNPVDYKEWDTYNGFPYFDYDMAIKVKESANGSLLVLGACNSYYHPSGDDKSSAVHILRIDPSTLNIIKQTSHFMPTGISYSGAVDRGMYGIDFVEDASTNSLFVLYNQFASNTVYHFGVLRLETNYSGGSSSGANDLETITSKTNYMTYGPLDYSAWGKQIIYNELVPGYKNFVIIGEIKSPYISCNNFTYSPSTTNINPFIANLFTYNTTNGIIAAGSGASVFKVEESSVGTTTTSASGFDYYTAVPSVASTNQEDVTRRGWFATTADPTTGDIQLLTPLQNPSNSNYLNVKFLNVNNLGDEIYCGQYTRDCFQGVNTGSMDSYVFPGQNGPSQHNTFITFNLVEHVDIATTYDCQDALNQYNGYKPTSVATTESVDAISIYPNPATSELNIKVNAKAGTDVQFVLTDITGKEVLNKIVNNTAKVNIQLPNLTPGVYIGTVNADGQMHTEKIVIE